MELRDLKSKLAALAVMGERIPVSLNYHDLSLLRPPSEWETYRVFSCQEQDQFAFGGISHPDGAFNIYATDPSAARSIADEMLHATEGRTPSALRGGETTASLLQDHPLLAKPPVRFKRFVAMRMPLRGSEKSESHRLRRATEQDIETVTAWHTNYNAELGEQFALLSADEIPDRRVYLFEDRASGDVIGGYMQTIKNADRYWLARFYIFPDHRKSGAGSALLKEVSAGKEQEEELHLHVVDTNQAAISFYKRLGMEEIETGFNAQLT